MMGPEAMGVANANLVWSDDKVCRNFLCGTCPHALFTNTVRAFSFFLLDDLIGYNNPTENGSWCMPKITHGALEDGVPRSERSKP